MVSYSYMMRILSSRGINQTITLGSTSILSETAGIVDTGTTLVLISSGNCTMSRFFVLMIHKYPTDAFSRYQRATGAVADRATGLLRLTRAQFAKLPSLNFHIGSTTFTLTANAQAWPVCVALPRLAYVDLLNAPQRALNTAIGGNTNSVYLVVNSLGTPTGEGFDFVNGMTFLERFYSVFGECMRYRYLSTIHASLNISQTPRTSRSALRPRRLRRRQQTR